MVRSSFEELSWLHRVYKVSVYWTRSTVAMETYCCSRLQKPLHQREAQWK